MLLGALAISLVINLLLFAAAFRLKSDKLTDASYALSFLAVDAYLYSKSASSAKAIVALMIAIWAIRIGAFLIYRIIKSGKDKRFDGVRERFFTFARFWVGQAVTVWVLMIPLGLTVHASKLRLLSVIGPLIWAAGLIIETLADVQKYRFRGRLENKDKWISTGLWRFSRHPNYFGEILIWVGVYVFLYPSLDPAERLIAFLSPLTIAFLLIFVTGIPPLEKSGQAKWGKIAAYKAYCARTSLLIPLPTKHKP